MAEVIKLFIEIPKGSRNKYEWDHGTRRFKLDRMLFSAVHYPGDYGFVLNTWAEDGDPLDALVILGEPTFPGCTIDGRVVGIFYMTDDQDPDYKIICVPHTDPRWSEVEEIEDVPSHLLDEIAHFFSIYKDLEGKTTKVGGFAGRKEALEELEADVRRFEEMDPSPAMP